MKKVRQPVPELDDRFRYAVEVRDRSWFQDLSKVSEFMSLFVYYMS